MSTLTSERSASAAASTGGTHAGHQVPALLAAAALLRIGAAGGTVAIPFFIGDLSGSSAGLRVGLVGSTQAASELVFAFVLARLADRIGRRRFIVGGPAIGCLALLLASLARSPLEIAGARLIEGIGAAAFVPTALGTIAAATSDDPRRRARASGAFEGSTLVGYIGGFLVGGFAYHTLHRGAFVILAGFYGAASLVCARWLPHVPPMPTSPISVVFRAIVGRGPIRTFIPAWLAVNAFVGAVVFDLPGLLRRDRGSLVGGQTLVHRFDERLVSGMLGIAVLVLVVGIVFWTPAIHRLGPPRVMRAAVPGAAGVIALLALMNHLAPHRAGWLVPLLVLGILVEAGFGPAAVAYLADCSERLTADRSALMAFYTVTLAGGGAVGGALGGAFVSWRDLDGLLLMAAVLITVAFVSMTVVVRTYGAERGHPGASPAPG